MPAIRAESWLVAVAAESPRPAHSRQVEPADLHRVDILVVELQETLDVVDDVLLGEPRDTLNRALVEPHAGVARPGNPQSAGSRLHAHVLLLAGEMFAVEAPEPRRVRVVQPKVQLIRVASGGADMIDVVPIHKDGLEELAVTLVERVKTKPIEKLMEL